MALLAFNRLPSGVICRLLDAGVDTFVSLIGEYTEGEYRTQQYPAVVSNLLSTGSATVAEARPVCFVHFPVRDFETPDALALSRFVDELKRRVLGGATMFIHCRGGHG